MQHSITLLRRRDVLTWFTEMENDTQKNLKSKLLISIIQECQLQKLIREEFIYEGVQNTSEKRLLHLV